MEESIVFLGTGGGRFVTTTQMRATGGFRINLENFCIHVDPGPGSLVRARQFNENPTRVKCLLVSHIHPDHSTDANVMIEAMSRSTTQKRGYLFASDSVINGVEKNDRCVSRYHLDFLEKYRIMKPEDSENVEGISITALKTEHRDPSTIGFRIETGKKTISYTSDTAYFEGLGKIHKNSDILVINALRPRDQKLYFHLCTNEAVKLISEAKPKLAVMQHFGMKMLNAGPIAEAKLVEMETGIRTIAAEDGMHISLDELKQKTLGVF